MSSPPQTPTDRILTLPNVITVARLVVFTPVVIFLLIAPETRLAATLALIIFSGTDWIDGFVARRWNQVSQLGRWLDPVADRVGVAWICFAMLILKLVPWWVPMVIITVDVVVLAVGLVLRERISQLRVLPLGKVRTAILMIGLPLAALGGSAVAPAEAIRLVAHVVLTLGAVLHLGAGVLYLYGLARSAPAVPASPTDDQPQIGPRD